MRTRRFYFLKLEMELTIGGLRLLLRKPVSTQPSAQ